MDETTIATDDDTTTVAETQQSDSQLIETELLVEEISIDGMCGVY